jgi:hypothetical protein
MQGTSASLWGNDALRNIQFACTGGSRANGGAPGTGRTGRKEKRYEDSSQKPKSAKFHRSEVRPNDPSLATAPTERGDCYRDAMPPPQRILSVV